MLPSPYDVLNASPKTLPSDMVISRLPIKLNSPLGAKAMAESIPNFKCMMNGSASQDRSHILLKLAQDRVRGN
jgi:hypothetical protein